VPERFVLRVDGVGSFLVLRRAAVTIGPVGTSRPPDVALAADPALPPVTVARLDDDYFLRPGGGAVTVNDRPVGGPHATAAAARLLADGDRLALAPRCRVTFAVPSPASTSAALDLTGARLAAAPDVRRVILMDRDLILGPGPAAHVRTDAVPAAGGGCGRVVLHVRDGRLWCECPGDRAIADAEAGGRPLDPHGTVPFGVAVRAGGLSFVVTAA
jgi:hypothetical protein